MNPPNQSQSTVWDLLRPLRTRAWIVALTAAIAVAASIGLSLSQQPKYSATATFGIQDQTAQLALAGLVASSTQTPAELANQAALTVQQPQVLRLVAREVGGKLSEAQLAGSAVASTNVKDNLVHITATGTSAEQAAAIANAFARQVVRVTNQNARAQYAAAVAELKRRQPSGSRSATAIYQDQLGRLEGLAAIAAPAQVTTLASPPSTPSSPRPVRNALLGGLLGLLVGVMLVYLLDSADRRLRLSRDVEHEWGYPLLGRVRDEALGQTPSARVEDRIVNPIDWEQFRILRRNLEFLTASSTGQLIAVTSAMPQEGKTTVACFVAFAAAAAGKRTLLVECDLRRPVLADRLSLQPHPGLTDFVAGRATPAKILQVVSFTDPVRAAVPTNGSAPDPDAALFEHEVACITAGSVTRHPVEILDSAAFNRMLEEVRQVYDVVILDTAPLLPVVDALEVIGKSDVVIVCARASKLTRGQARAGREALDRAPQSKIGLVVTGIRPSRDEYGAGYQGYYEYAGR